MITKNLSPFAFGTKLCSRHPPQPEMTVVALGTYTIAADGTLSVVDDSVERAPVTGDLFYEDDRESECIHASDFADFKLSSEVLLVGSCHAPWGRAVADCPVQVSVGEWSKALHVFGNRKWTATGISAAEPFERMELCYRNAFGGPGYAPNPVGKGLEGKALPNVEVPTKLIVTPLDRPPAASFGPVHPDWAERRKKMGTQYGRAYLEDRAPYYAVDFDWRFFSAGQADQQLGGYLRGDEPFRLVNLHPDAPKVDGVLPSLRTRAFVQDVMGRFREVVMSLDTVVFSVDERRLYLSWRGVDPVLEDDLEDVELLLVATEPLEAPALELDHYRGIMKAFADDPVGLKADLPPELLELAARMEAVEPGEDPYPDAPEQGNPVSNMIARKLGPFAPEMQATIREGIEAAQRSFDEGVAKAAEGLGKVEQPSEEELALARQGAAEPLGEVEPLGETVLEKQNKLALALEEAAAQDFDSPPVPTIPKPGALPDPGLRRKMRAAFAQAAELRARAEDESTPEPARAKLREAAEELEKVPYDPGWTLLDPDYTPPVEPIPTDEPGPGANLSEQDLSGRDLRGYDLSGANLEATILTKANLAGVSLRGANLRKAILYKTDLSEADLRLANLSRVNAGCVHAPKACLRGASLDEGFFERANLEGADLREVTGSWQAFARAKLTGANAQGCQLHHADFRHAELTEADFSGADLVRCVFASCKMTAANFSDAKLEHASFAEANATGAHFVGALAPRSLWLSTRIDGADFRYATLTDAHLTKASAKEAVFSFANLRECRLYRARLVGAELREANLFKADLCKARLSATDFTGSNLYDAKFLGAQGKGTVFTNAILTMSTLER